MGATVNRTARNILGTLVAATAALGILTGCTSNPATSDLVNEVTGNTPAQVEVAPVESGTVDFDPTPVSLGEEYSVGYGGTVDAVTFKVTRVDRCDSVLRVGVELTTGNIYQNTDHPFFRTSYIDTEGFTNTDTVRTGANGCGDEIASGYSVLPGQKYRGFEFFEIPQGAATELRFHPMDHHEFSINVEGI